MKILLLSPTPTHPTTAGNRARVLALSRGLRKLGHEVHFALATVGEADVPALRQEFGEHLHLLNCRVPHALRAPTPRLWRRFLAAIGHEGAYLYKLDDHYDPGITPQLRAIIAGRAFDAMFVEYVFMSRAFEAAPANAIKILDTHDRFALRHRMFLRAGQKPQWFSTTPAEEARGLRRADWVLAIQEDEARVFTEQLGPGRTRVATVSHVVDEHEQVQSPPTPSAVFLASGNPINVEAARYFIEQVLPHVQREQPRFRLILAGDVGDAFRSQGDAVTCLGRVSSPAVAFRSAAIAVNPVRTGSGLNIKLLDALAHGVACVSSATGSRGLERFREHAFKVVPDDDPEAMARAAIELLNDRDRAARLARSAHAAAQEWNRDQQAALARVLERSAGSEAMRPHLSEARLERSVHASSTMPRTAESI